MRQVESEMGEKNLSQSLRRYRREKMSQGCNEESEEEEKKMESDEGRKGQIG